jgi:hypothetical protein
MDIKTYRKFVASIIETLESLGIIYAIGGSFASTLYQSRTAGGSSQEKE